MRRLLSSELQQLEAVLEAGLAGGIGGVADAGRRRSHLERGVLARQVALVHRAIGIQRQKRGEDVGRPALPNFSAATMLPIFGAMLPSAASGLRPICTQVWLTVCTTRVRPHAARDGEIARQCGQLRHQPRREVDAIDGGGLVQALRRRTDA